MSTTDSFENVKQFDKKYLNKSNKILLGRKKSVVSEDSVRLLRCFDQIPRNPKDCHS